MFLRFSPSGVETADGHVQRGERAFGGEGGCCFDGKERQIKRRRGRRGGGAARTRENREIIRRVLINRNRAV